MAGTLDLYFICVFKQSLIFCFILKVEGLTPGHEYKFRVKAINKEGESEPLDTYGAIVAKDPYSKCIELPLLCDVCLTV